MCTRVPPAARAGGGLGRGGAWRGGLSLHPAWMLKYNPARHRHTSHTSPCGSLAEWSLRSPAFRPVNMCFTRSPASPSPAHQSTAHLPSNRFVNGFGRTYTGTSTFCSDQRGLTRPGFAGCGRLAPSGIDSIWIVVRSVSRAGLGCAWRGRAGLPREGRGGATMK